MVIFFTVYIYAPSDHVSLLDCLNYDTRRFLIAMSTESHSQCITQKPYLFAPMQPSTIYIVYKNVFLIGPFINDDNF